MGSEGGARPGCFFLPVDLALMDLEEQLQYHRGKGGEGNLINAYAMFDWQESRKQTHLTLDSLSCHLALIPRWVCYYYTPAPRLIVVVHVAIATVTARGPSLWLIAILILPVAVLMTIGWRLVLRLL